MLGCADLGVQLLDADPDGVDALVADQRVEENVQLALELAPERGILLASLVCAIKLCHLIPDQVAHEGLYLRHQPLSGSCLVVACPKREAQRIHVFRGLCSLIFLHAWNCLLVVASLSKSKSKNNFSAISIAYSFISG